MGALFEANKSDIEINDDNKMIPRCVEMNISFRFSFVKSKNQQLFARPAFYCYNYINLFYSYNYINFFSNYINLFSNYINLFSNLPPFTCSIHLRHSALEHNRRCVLAYLKQRLNRITQFRWDHGAVLPEEIQVNMQEHEVTVLQSSLEFFRVFQSSLEFFRVLQSSLGFLEFFRVQLEFFRVFLRVLLEFLRILQSSLRVVQSSVRVLLEFFRVLQSFLDGD